VGHPAGAGGRLAAGERPVEIAVVDGEVALLGDEPRDVQHRETDERPGQPRVVPRVSHSPDDLDAVRFAVVGWREEKPPSDRDSPSTTVTGMGTGSPR